MCLLVTLDLMRDLSFSAEDDAIISSPKDLHYGESDDDGYPLFTGTLVIPIKCCTIINVYSHILVG